MNPFIRPMLQHLCKYHDGFFRGYLLHYLQIQWRLQTASTVTSSEPPSFGLLLLMMMSSFIPV